jgi:type II secretory ATPase GspE/PulE/Tfp pilus assembly ATPase PilB-like protein
VVAQRLVRKLCPDCTESKPVDENLKALILDQAARSNKFRTNLEVPAQLYYGRGCPKCGGTGYRGQIGIFEVLDASPEITDLILKKESAEMVKSVALQQGMITMFEDGLEKAESGITSIDEVFRVIRA